jgi:hypothetical protein
MTRKPPSLPGNLRPSAETSVPLYAAGCLLLLAAVALAEPVAVRQPERDAHSTLLLSTLTGERLADGELVQRVDGSRVTTRVTFPFADGSLHEETVVFTQQRHFRVISDHLIQKGPAFPRAVDLRIDGATAPADLANGVLVTLLKNVTRERPFKSVSWMAATAKPRMVKLETKSAASETLNGRVVTHYRLHVDVGGMSGVLAPMVGKQPPDVHIWIEEGTVPAFVRSEQPLYVGGPVWRIDAVGATP